MSALTTTSIGLDPSHPPVWRLTLTWAGATLTVYSLTKPRPTDDGTWIYDAIPDDFFRSGYPNPKITPAAWTQPVLGFAVTQVPMAGATNRDGTHPGRPVRVPDDELRALIRAHAEELAKRLGPLGFPRTLPGGGPGWSQSNLSVIIATDDRITGGSQRLRAVCRSVLAEVKAAWVEPAAARTPPPPALHDPTSLAALEALSNDTDPDPDEWREILYEWGDWYRTRDDAPLTKRDALITMGGWLTGWPSRQALLRLYGQVWDEQWGDA
jgi:hypothetical protein